MSPLPTELRNKLERTIIAAREVGDVRGKEGWGMKDEG
jgi:hypothetical protein